MRRRDHLWCFSPCNCEPPFRRAVPTTPADRVGAHVDYFPTRAAFPK
jgi:hypothetical protein